MQKFKNLTIYLYNHRFVRYLFVGGTTFVIDLGTLVLLHGKLKVNIAFATSVAYWLSVVFNFTLTRWWTFSSSENNSLKKHLLFYSMLLAVNYLFTVASVSLASQHINYALAKVLAVAIQVSWTYPLYKNYVFGNRHLGNDVRNVYKGLKK